MAPAWCQACDMQFLYFVFLATNLVYRFQNPKKMYSYKERNANIYVAALWRI